MADEFLETVSEGLRGLLGVHTVDGPVAMLYDPFVMALT